jgi:hypothetical protein
MLQKRLRDLPWAEILFMTGISALVYLPRVADLKFSQLDDWFYVYNGLVSGANVFMDMLLHMRPIRGPLYEFYFLLFGLHPLPYNLTLYFWRLVGGFGALWLFNQLWPGRRIANFFMAVFFLVFPGLAWWIAGLSFQPQILSLCLEVFSIVFTLEAIRSDSVGGRIAWSFAAILSGWIYLALVEYAIGMEVFRLLCVFLFIWHRNGQPSLRQVLSRSVKSSTGEQDSSKRSRDALTRSAREGVRAYAPFFVIPVGFVFWYLFIFENWRKAQDASAQLSRMLDTPSTALWWLLRLFQGTFNVTLLAWAVPFYQYLFSGRLRDILLNLAFAGLVIVAAVWADRHLKAKGQTGAAIEHAAEDWQIEALVTGLLGTIAGVVPIVMANRIVAFENLSHYTLPAALAGAVFLGGLVFLIRPGSIRTAVLASLVAIAAMTHLSVATKAINEERAMTEFWWQMTWRAPSIQPNTMLVVVYPDVESFTGNEFVWGPANSIYYPERQNGSLITVALAAAPLEPDTLDKLIMGAPTVEKTDLIMTRTVKMYTFQNILVLTQPASTSCVHAIDPRWSGLSTSDNALVVALASRSRIENIAPDAPPPHPSELLFGSEPAREWCYYFEKADLARQQGKWEEVASLGDRVLKMGLRPRDLVEWMPFLQAYAARDDFKEVRDMAKRINGVAFYKYQACLNLTGMAEQGYPLSPEMDAQVQKLFCLME